MKIEIAFWSAFKITQWIFEKFITRAMKTPRTTISLDSRKQDTVPYSTNRKQKLTNQTSKSKVKDVVSLYVALRGTRRSHTTIWNGTLPFTNYENTGK